MATLILPSILAKFTQKERKLVVSGNNLRIVLLNLINDYPQLKPYLLDEENKLCSHVSVYLNDKDVRYLEREETPITDSDILKVIPAIAGG